jgi:hypothetical protein
VDEQNGQHDEGGDTSHLNCCSFCCMSMQLLCVHCLCVSVEYHSPRYTNSAQYHSPRYTNSAQYHSPRYTNSVQYYSPRYTNSVQYYSPRYTNSVQYYSPRYTNSTLLKQVKHSLNVVYQHLPTETIKQHVMYESVTKCNEKRTLV